MTHEDRLVAAGITLPPPCEALGCYVPTVRSGMTLYVSGHGPLRVDGTRVVGKVGSELGLTAAREAARIAAVSALASIRSTVGSLNYVASIDRVFGMVNVARGFTQLSPVMDGCSELLLDIFGEAGRHARSAVGVAELPGGIAVEIELIATLVGC